MGRIDKTVFLSYRRTNIGYALAIYQNLTAKGYDVFFDYNSIDSGDFEQIILNNIASRAHFLVLLTPSALERVHEEGDWLRREIEYAIETKRNIVPLTMEDFDWKYAQDKLIGKLASLGNYNALRVPADYFMEAMDRLASRFLNIELDAVIHPRNVEAENAATVAKTEADSQPEVQEKELTAQEWFEKGYQSTDYDEKIKCYSEAIRLKPNFFEAYNNRGNAHRAKGDFNAAIEDYNEAIRLYPNYDIAYNNRGTARSDKGELNGAIKDYNEAIRLKPDFADAYHNRGNTRYDKGELDEAIGDYNEAIRLKPDYASAYNNRGTARSDKGELNGAISDYNEAIRREPDYAPAYNNRAWTYYLQKNYAQALIDASKSLDLDTTNDNALHTRGAIHLALGNIRQAIADFESALEINPSSQAAQTDLAKAKTILEGKL